MESYPTTKMNGDPDTETRAAGIAAKLVEERCSLHSQTLEQLVKEVTELKEEVRKMSTALQGDQYNKSGICERLAQCEKRISEMETQRNMARGAFWAFGLSGTAIGALLAIIFKYFFGGKTP